MSSIGADGMRGVRHTKDSDLCTANVDHAMNTVCGMAHTLDMILEQYIETSPVYSALLKAKKQLSESAKDIVHYM